jgi:predicted ATP-binding protein involved in virulence
MITDLSRRLVLANPKMQNPLEGEGVVLIDELELHLHPKWQREVVEKLRRTFPKIQFICTTHSPFIIQSLRAGELITLDPEEFPAEYLDKSIEDITEDVMRVDMPQKSVRYQAMIKAAEEYFRLLRSVDRGSDEELMESEQRLNELAEPFSDDPAFQALLKVERESLRLGGEGAAS